MAMNYETRYTPRDRVLDPEIVAEYLELFKIDPVAWELYYSDGSFSFGTTQDEWNEAPDYDVQILVWKTTERIVHLVYGSDVYIMGGVNKYGKWMHDPSFFKMRDEIGLRSPIYLGK